MAKVTPEIVDKILLYSKRGLTAKQIHEKLTEEGIYISLWTVYKYRERYMKEVNELIEKLMEKNKKEFLKENLKLRNFLDKTFKDCLEALANEIYNIIEKQRSGKKLSTKERTFLKDATALFSRLRTVFFPQVEVSKTQDVYQRMRAKYLKKAKVQM